MQTAGKLIGTLVPLSALYSTTNSRATFEAGVLFLDWISKSGQNAWQMLPVHETQLEEGSAIKHVPSPYKGYGIGLDPKYLSEGAKQQMPTQEQLNIFIDTNRDWLPDYALFCALRDYFQTDDWSTWQNEIKKRDPQALQQITAKLDKEINQYILEQWQCIHAYSLFREKAKEKHITLIGDIPYYIGHRGPLVWAHHSAFELRRDGSMPYVSGALNRPHAYFGRQLWGHPLYNWSNHLAHKSIIDLWKIRLVHARNLFDIVRIDHANGFFRYGALDPANPRNDARREGPGFEVFRKVINYCKLLKIAVIAEDAGLELKTLRAALDRLRIPGVYIFRFAFNDKSEILIPYYAHVKNYARISCAYTSLHDTEPLLGYLKKLTGEQKQLLAKEAEVTYTSDDKKLAVALRQAVIDSPATTVVIPIQDWLLTEDRINIPGTERARNDPNWQYSLPTPVEQLPMPLST